MKNIIILSVSIGICTLLLSLLIALPYETRAFFSDFARNLIISILFGIISFFILLIIQYLNPLLLKKILVYFKLNE